MTPEDVEPSEYIIQDDGTRWCRFCYETDLGLRPSVSHAPWCLLLTAETVFAEMGDGPARSGR